MSIADALQLVTHCEQSWSGLTQLHDESIERHTVMPAMQIEVKNFVENLRSALDYCASELFRKYGHSKKSSPRIYFPYARPPQRVAEFKSSEVERCIPGLWPARPDIVEKLAEYQYFGHTGNWLPILMKIVNEHKHEHLTPQIQKTYEKVTIRATIPAGQRVKIDLTQIPRKPTPHKPYHGTLSAWTGLEFATTGVMVIPLLQPALRNVRRIVEALSALCGITRGAGSGADPPVAPDLKARSGWGDLDDNQAQPLGDTEVS